MSKLMIVIEFLAVGFGFFCIMIGYMINKARQGAKYVQETKAVEYVSSYTKEQINTAQAKAHEYMAVRAAARDIVNSKKNKKAPVGDDADVIGNS